MKKHTNEKVRTKDTGGGPSTATFFDESGVTVQEIIGQESGWISLTTGRR